MATTTTAMLRILIGTCLLYHVTLVTGDDDYMTAEDITPTAYKCFQDEAWPCALPLTDFPWNHTSMNHFLQNANMPALFPEEQKADYRAFLALFNKAKIYSLLGACMGYGHRLLLLRDLFGHYFGALEDPPADPDVIVEDITMAGIPVKLYTPTAAHSGNRAAIFYIHGGGWTLGSAAEMDGITRRMAVRGNFVVASVDYRLAPEHRFPKGFNDCLKAIKYFINHATDYDVDSTRIAVSGDSSGGNLAAAVSLKLRNEEFRPKLKMQALIYPVLQAVNFNTPSYQANACDAYLDRPWMMSFWMWYAYGNMASSMLPVLGSNAHTTAAGKASFADKVDTSLVPADLQLPYDPTPVVLNGNATVWNHMEHILTNIYFSPLLANTMEDLPHTYMFTCSQDVLRDEGLIYAARLRAQGVTVKQAYHHALHALVDNLSVPYASEAVNEMIDYLIIHL